LTAPVTIQQLLSNTGGIPDYYALPAYFRDVQADPTQPWTVDEFLAHTLPRGLTFAPGQGWGYSNVGFLLLKLVIEQVTHQSLRTVVQERMVAPLRLQHTLVAEALDDAQILTPGYSAFLRDDDTLEDIRSRYHPGWVSHGVVISTAPDLARIYEAVFTGQLVHPRLLAAMQVPVLVPGQHPLFHQTAYGLGVMLDPQAAYGTVAGHGGEGPGYSAAALCFPNVAGHRVISVALVNRDQHDAGLTIAFRLVDALAAWLEREREAEADRQRAR
jgi:D-alanyl-D-alanine carboxypeptidase